jgi:hypothetical protein
MISSSTTRPRGADGAGHGPTARRDVDGVLLLYHRYLHRDAATVDENVTAFKRHSRFPVFEVNTDMGFPRSLHGLRFAAVLLHYSLFAPSGYHLDERFRAYLDEQENSYKVAFFQDEHHYCRQRFAFLDRHGIQCVYTMLDPEWGAKVYGEHTKVETVVSHLPGYVSEEMVRDADRFALLDERRPVDIGYRGRRLAPYMGRGALEKYEIGIRFRERAASLDLALDIACEESDRIYGDDWGHFIGSCRSTLGTESGTSIFDLDDSVRERYAELVAERPELTAEEFFAACPLEDREEQIPYRTISPRHFEAAAYRTAQILYEGRYSGILEPHVHYLPLRKDFANFDEVVAASRDRAVRQELTDNAHRDLIASGAFGYRRFVQELNDRLEGMGLRTAGDPDAVRAATSGLARDAVCGRARQRIRHVVHRADAWDFRGRDRVVELARPLLEPVVRRARGWAYPARHGEPQD